GAQLEDREKASAWRQAIAARLTAGLSGLQDALQLPAARPGSEHAYMMYPLTLVDDRIPRDALIEHLESHGVETRYLLPLINQPIYRATFGNLDAEYPVAARLNQRAFYVGCHADMSE